MRFLRSLVGSFVTVWVVVTIVFFMIHAAPGGPFDNERAMNPVQKEQLEKVYGLDRPIWEQYTIFLSNLVHGNLGVSLVMEGESVREIITRTFPVSFGVGVGALIVAIGVGVPLGFWWSASAQGSGVTRRVRNFSKIVFVFSMLPSFVLAPLVQQVVLMCGGVAYGYAGVRSLILPAIILGLYYLPFVARLVQTGFREESKSLYLRVAQAKGLSRWKALLKHGCRAALSPVLAYLGPAAAGLITGSFIVETVWGLPGMGRFFVNAVFNRDDTLLLGLVVFYTIILVGLNLAIELILQKWNPAITKESKY